MGQDRSNVPDGFKVVVSRVPHANTARWEVSRVEGGATWRVHASNLDAAHQKGAEYAWALHDEANPPKPADPGWMVEVATEIQKRLDDDDGYPAAIIALRLALERGHVVERRPVSTGLELIQAAREAVALVEEDARPGNEIAASLRRGEHDNSYSVKAAETAIRLVIHPQVRGLSEEELLKAAREDAAQALEAGGWTAAAREIRLGMHSAGHAAIAALQARRNMLREMGAVAAPASPSVDLEAALKRAWDAGADAMADAVGRVYREAKGPNADLLADSKRVGISNILSTLPAKE